MSKRQAIEAAIAAWRDVDRRLNDATDGNRAVLEQELHLRRSEFHRLSSEHVMERMAALHEAEQRRQSSTPSTRDFHQAAQDEALIAADIWDEARRSDRDIPHHPPSQAALTDGHNRQAPSRAALTDGHNPQPDLS